MPLLSEYCLAFLVLLLLLLGFPLLMVELVFLGLRTSSSSGSFQVSNLRLGLLRCLVS